MSRRLFIRPDVVYNRVIDAKPEIGIGGE